MRQITRKLAVLGLVVVTVSVGWLVLGSYQQRFDDWVTVTVVADRAGLVMDRGAKVTMTGVDVGEVTAIEYGSDQARLTLRVHRSALASIPADVTAEITSNTVFGAKFVSLDAPAQAAAARLAPGAEIDISRVTVEINTVFEQLTNLLRVVDPAQLEATLGALATALQGRGDRLGAAIDHAAGVLAQLNAADPGFAELLRTAAPTTQLYADIAPDLLRTLDALTTTGHSVVDEQRQLSALLISTTAVSNTGSDLLAHNGSGLADLLRLLDPTTALLALYSPEIPCVFRGITAGNASNPAAYAGQPGIKMFAGLIPGATPYRYPEDLPKVNATGGPNCMGLPYTDPVVNVPYMVTDTGANPYDPSRQAIGLRTPDLVSYLLGIGGGR
ncbi:MCE family protein [Nocardia pseudovaccinii]|uniref:MCE family protein n=1 Tax=Nocardia pseudovaccinii TaxID=189540 RepID=UPI001471CE28|nr:MCE family protein [Nocardia pseudovaccinii]